MSYISIYRKYRPYTFDQVVGQEHIVRILKNQVKNDTISHAYLFTGTRGTGKTSIAKIFARAVNCEHNKNGSACGKCDTCLQLANPANLDIIEIDAASNNGVDEIRELREQVKYPPVSCKYKVYIIDEVHMLSIGAFNALLKTLEEPPKHVVFILATTEVHKLPQTILSRCLRFDFRLVPTSKIAERIAYIFDDMGITYTNDAILSIAEAGDGSVRDALSIADMCVSYGEGKVNYETVLDVLGASNPNTIIDLIQAILNGDLATCFEIVDNLATYGKSMTNLAKDLTKSFRNLYITITTPNANKILNLPSEIFKRLFSFTSCSQDRVLQCVDILSGLEANMRFSSSPRTLLESAIAKCADEKANIDLMGVVVRLKALEEKINSGDFSVKKNDQQVKKRIFSKSACCGFLIKSARDLKKFALYTELSELDKDNFYLDGSIIHIRPSNQSNQKTLLEEEYFNLISSLLKNEFEGIAGVEIDEANKIVNIDDDINYVKSLFNNDIVKLN